MIIASSRLIPFWVKLAYTAFMALLVPIYLKNYGPTNFLYFCDVAAFLTLVAIWRESSLLLSTALIGIFIPQMIWVVDFMAEVAGMHLTGMTSYMFKPPFFLRFLSFFHFWLPFLLVWLIWRVGYDRRGILLWSAIMWVLITVCYAWMPPTSPSLDPPLNKEPLVLDRIESVSGTVPEYPGRKPYELVTLIDAEGTEIAKARTQRDGSYMFASVPPGKYRVQLRDPNIPVNINYVYNIKSDDEPQKWMDPDLYVAVYMVTLVCGVYPLTHLLFCWWMPVPSGTKPRAINTEETLEVSSVQSIHVKAK